MMVMIIMKIHICTSSNVISTVYLLLSSSHLENIWFEASEDPQSFYAFIFLITSYTTIKWYFLKVRCESSLTWVLEFEDAKKNYRNYVYLNILNENLPSCNKYAHTCSYVISIMMIFKMMMKCNMNCK